MLLKGLWVSKYSESSKEVQEGYHYKVVKGKDNDTASVRD